MERIIYRKTLDVHKSGVQFTLQGFQTADNMSRTLELSLMASGDTIDLPLEQLMAVMYVTTPNATEPSINECTIKDNAIVCDVLPIVEEGITEIQIKLIDTRVDGAKGVLATPEFAIEVSKSKTNEEGATQNTTFTALETALAKAKGVYDSRLIGIELDSDCMFRAIYADGTVYETDILKELFLKGDALLSQSYARGGTGVRANEDTDNSLYYSNVSKSASQEAKKSSELATEILNETKQHSVFTVFTVDFKSGEVKYISPKYSFCIDKETGELNISSQTYDFSDTINQVVLDWLEKTRLEISQIQLNNRQQSLKIDNLQTFTDSITDYVVEQGVKTVSFTTMRMNKSSNADIAIDPSKPDTDIIENSEQATWKYRKWASGRAECWTASCGVVTRITQPYGSLFISEHSFPQIDFPFDMAVGNEAPICNFDISYTTAYAGYVFATDPDYSYSKIPKIYAWNPTKLGESYPVEITARVFVIGRWK